MKLVIQSVIQDIDSSVHVSACKSVLYSNDLRTAQWLPYRPILLVVRRILHYRDSNRHVLIL